MTKRVKVAVGTSHSIIKTDSNTCIIQSVEVELALQESQITGHLASVREKLSGIRAVMPLFVASADSTSEPAESDRH